MVIPFDEPPWTCWNDVNDWFASVENLKGLAASNLILDLSPVGLHLPHGNGFHDLNFTGVLRFVNF